MTRRRRILYIQKPSGGGSATALYELVRGLDTDTYEPIVLFHGWSQYSERFQALGVRVITLNEQADSPRPARPRLQSASQLKRLEVYKTARKMYWFARRDLPVIWRVAHLISDEAIDLVHQNNSLKGSLATVIAARLAKVPQVCHVRFMHNYSAIHRYIARFVNYFIYISEAVEQSCRALAPASHRGRIVYDPVDIEAFAQANHRDEIRAEFGVANGDPLICNVGRLDPWKGQDFFLQGMTQVIRSYPNAKALIVGDNSSKPRGPAYYQRLQQLARDLNLSRHVTFTGFRPDVPQIMAAADVVVHSSSKPEPFGLVVVEAMAASRPVVATAAGGVLDIIEDQMNGLLVPPGDPARMAKAVMQLLENPHQARMIGQRACKHVKTRFTVKSHVEAIERIYREVLASRPA